MTSAKLGRIIYPFQGGRHSAGEGLDQRPLSRRAGRALQKVEFGWPNGMPYCRSLGKGLWEVRSDLTDGKIGRILFCMILRRMVLLHGFIKKRRRPTQRILNCLSNE